MNKKSNIKYVWNKMKTIKNSFNTVDWRKWQKKDRREMVLEEMDKIAAPWVEKEVEIEEEEERKEEETLQKEEEEEGLNIQFKEEELERAMLKNHLPRG